MSDVKMKNKKQLKCLKYCAVKKWLNGGESVIEYFESQEDALRWIIKQKKSDEFIWCVGEF